MGRCCFSGIYSFNNHCLKNLPFNKALQNKVSTFLPQVYEVFKIYKKNFLLNYPPSIKNHLWEGDLFYKKDMADEKRGCAGKENLLLRFFVKFSLFFQKLYDNLFKAIQPPSLFKESIEDELAIENNTSLKKQVELNPIQAINQLVENGVENDLEIEIPTQSKDFTSEMRIENKEKTTLQESEYEKVASNQNTLKELLKSKRKSLSKPKININKKSSEAPLVRSLKRNIESMRIRLSGKEED